MRFINNCYFYTPRQEIAFTYIIILLLQFDSERKKKRKGNHFFRISWIIIIDLKNSFSVCNFRCNFEWENKIGDFKFTSTIILRLFLSLSEARALSYYLSRMIFIFYYVFSLFIFEIDFILFFQQWFIVTNWHVITWMAIIKIAFVRSQGVYFHFNFEYDE